LCSENTIRSFQNRFNVRSDLCWMDADDIGVIIMLGFIFYMDFRSYYPIRQGRRLNMSIFFARWIISQSYFQNQIYPTGNDYRWNLHFLKLFLVHWLFFMGSATFCFFYD
jgi:hypothetical protein